MKISEIITDKYKLRIPPTVYYELLDDVQEAEEPKTGHWIPHVNGIWIEYYTCSKCGKVHDTQSDYCEKCGIRMVEPPAESEGEE